MPPIEGRSGSGRTAAMNPTSWADQMDTDEGHAGLPPTQEISTGNTKIVTEYRIVDGKKLKVTRTYKVERKTVSKTVAARKNWRKFGEAINDKPGPSAATTTVGDDIYMHFISSKDDERTNDADHLEKLKSANTSAVKCRYCSLEHFSIKCPYKDKLDQTLPAGDDVGDGPRGSGTTVGGKYIPPSQRQGGNLKGESMSARGKDDATNTVRVTNLPEDVQDQDIKDLFNIANIPGRVTRIFLAKDKFTGQSKGFAFVSFDTREAADMAIRAVNGHLYAHLVLNVELAKPSQN